MHQPTHPREPRTADRLGIPIPIPERDGDQRAAWFTELGTVIGVDCLGIAAQQLAAGASPSATEQLLRDYRDWLSGHVAGVVDEYLCRVSLYAGSVAA